MKLRRAIVVLMPAQGQAAPDIQHLLDCSPDYVRTVIDAFNESGFQAWVTIPMIPNARSGGFRTWSEAA